MDLGPTPLPVQTRLIFRHLAQEVRNSGFIIYISYIHLIFFGLLLEFHFYLFNFFRESCKKTDTLNWGEALLLS